MTQEATIAAGILHYRFWPQVSSTIDGLLAQTRQPDRILVLDHASGDASATSIREAYPMLEVIELEDNAGPAGGMDRLVASLLELDVDAFMVLPHDIDLAPDALEHLAERLAADPALGAVGPLVAHQRDRERIFYAGGHVDPRTWDLQLCERPKHLADWRGQPPRSVDFLELGGILIRSQAARQVDGIPAHFYYVHDDVDFTLQIAAGGWRLECVPAAVAWQDLGDPTRSELLVPMSPYLLVRNRLGLIARNAPRRILARELVRTVVWLVRIAIRPGQAGRSELRPKMRGLIDFCRGRWGPPPL